MKNILILYGGDSPEREVSLKSGETVAEAARNAGYEVKLLDTKNGFDGIKDFKNQTDYVFPILHGINGEDGSVQKVLEVLGMKYLGANSSASEKAFDKIETHVILEKHGIKMPKFAAVSLKDLDNHLLFKNPYVLKPIKGGSSLDTQIARVINSTNINESRRLLLKYPEMLLEELIEGKEITVPVLGKNSLDVIAIIPPENEEFNYENKYNDKSQEICPAPKDFLQSGVQKIAQKQALEIHKLLGIRHLSRTDFIVNKDDEIYVLEINTMPGMRPQSLFPKAAKRAGIDMESLTKKFVAIIEEE